MKWEPFSIRFRQHFPDGWGYLDHCGQFMSSLATDFGVMPVDATPSGAKLCIPEKGISVNADTSHVEVTQEMPLTPGYQDFRELCDGVSRSANISFKPSQIDMNQLEIKFMLRMNSMEEAQKFTLGFPNSSRSVFADTLDMQCLSSKFDEQFISGARILNVVAQVVTFENVSSSRMTHVIGTPPSRKERVNRLNAKADRMPLFPPYAIFLEITLNETAPPEDAIGELLTALISKAEEIKKLFPIK